MTQDIKEQLNEMRQKMSELHKREDELNLKQLKRFSEARKRELEALDVRKLVIFTDISRLKNLLAKSTT